MTPLQRRSISCLALTAVLAVLGAGCASSHEGTGVSAINLRTGERASFADTGSVPAGWGTCSADGTCPALTTCTDLDESPCIARPDCAPAYAVPTGTTCASGDPSCDAFAACYPVDPPPPVGDGGIPTDDGGTVCPAIACATDCVVGTHHGVDDRGCPTCACVPDDPPCTDTECGPEPLGVPNYLCDDGSTGGPVCGRGADGTCGWTIRTCPTPPPPPPVCTATECGPEPLGVPNYLCDDGSTGGPVCERGADGTCGWTIRTCPTPPPPPPPECSVSACGPLNFLVPSYDCDDGTPVQAVCEVGADGSCGWGLSCPAPCTNTECGPNPYGAPNYVCGDGSTGGPVCDRASDGTCGWTIRACPGSAPGGSGSGSSGSGSSGPGSSGGGSGSGSGSGSGPA